MARPAKPPPTVEETDAAALAQVRRYCGWHVAPSQMDTLVLDGPGSGTLILPSLYVTNVASVVEDGTPLDPESFSWSRAGVMRRHYSGSSYWSVSSQSRWTSQLRGITVAITHGFPEMPADLQAVVSDLSARMGASFGGLESLSIGPFSESYGGEPTATGMSRATLDSYRLPRLA